MWCTYLKVEYLTEECWHDQLSQDLILTITVCHHKFKKK